MLFLIFTFSSFFPNFFLRARLVEQPTLPLCAFFASFCYVSPFRRIVSFVSRLMVNLDYSFNLF